MVYGRKFQEQYLKVGVGKVIEGEAVQINVTAPPNTGKSGVVDYLRRRYSDIFGESKVATVKYPVYRPEDHGLTDYLDTGRRIDEYIRGNGDGVKNPENWDVREAQSWYAINRFFFDIKIREWLETKEVIISEDGKYTSVVWGCLMDQNISRRELEQLNEGIIEPDIRFTLRGPRLGGIEPSHIFEQSSLWNDCKRVHLELAGFDGWEIIDYERLETEDSVKKERERVGEEIVKRSSKLFPFETQRRLGSW